MQFQWTVVGAGPAGIAALGKLIDNGIDPKTIAWVDPNFQVGDFGEKWRNVSSNTRVDLFTKFLQACQSFDYQHCREKFALHQLDPAKTCQLHYAADPLLWVTESLKAKVHVIEDKVLKLKMENRHWQLTTTQGNIESKNVVLALGSEPKSLPSSPIPVIPMVDAMDKERLAKWVSANDTIAVFGSSHSAIIVIRSLLELGVKQVINFYRGALRYAVYLDDWILFDNTGLKGETAIWAREHIDGNMPKNLIRVWSDEQAVKAYLPQCTQAIHAIGFGRRSIPVEGLPVLEYNDRSGIIAPGLFGCGIAFPETTVDRFGNVEANVGLWKFMNYLHRVVPVWLKYST
jgi:cation diffusion facilitator CzcD-associated flavoprotein CzcO